MTNETGQGLERLSWLPDRDEAENGLFIAGQKYYDVYFTGGTISGIDIEDATFISPNFTGTATFENIDVNGTATLDGLTDLNQVRNIRSYFTLGNPASAQGISVYGNIRHFADQYILQCTDTSAFIYVDFSGTATTGDTITISFIFGAYNIPLSYTMQPGDTVGDLALIFSDLIEANPILYSAPTDRNPAGGGAPGQILNSDGIGTRLFLDYNVTVPMTMTSNVTGAATEIITLPNGGSPLPEILDANPVIDIQRIPGVAPAPQSNIGQLRFISSRSDSPVQANTVYTSINVTVKNSTAGSITGQLEFILPNGNGSGGNGWYMGGTTDSGGLFGVNTTGGNTGNDTINGKGFFINGNSIYKGAAGGSAAASGLTLTAANIINGSFQRQTQPNATDTFPTAASIVAALPMAKVGDVFRFTAVNQMTGNWDLLANTGVTIGTATGNITIGGLNSITFECYVSNVGSGTEQVIIYGAGRNYASRIGTEAIATNAEFYPLFAASTTNGYQVPNLDAGISYNPSLNQLSTTYQFLANSADPTTPTGGGILYTKAGALYFKGSSGTVTPIAPA
jgi:hypothetical protein